MTTLYTSHTYCDVFTVITSKQVWLYKLLIDSPEDHNNIKGNFDFCFTSTTCICLNLFHDIVEYYF